MEKNDHYLLSGSFDGLSDAAGDGGHYFKSSFAKSMALETTKSLDMTRNNALQQRYNTIGSQRVNIDVYDTCPKPKYFHAKLKTTFVRPKVGYLIVYFYDEENWFGWIEFKGR